MPNDQSPNPSYAKLINYSRRALQPRYWPELVRRATTLVAEPRHYDRAETRCDAAAVSRDQAYDILGLALSDRLRFAEVEPAMLGAAGQRVAAASERMGGGADVDLLYACVRAWRAERVVETGVAFGWSSLAILAAMAGRPAGRLVSVDLPYLRANSDAQVGLAVPETLRPGWTLLRGADRDFLEKAIAQAAPLDLAHYDSDKSYPGRIWAYGLLFDALRPGGLLISDDIQDNHAFFDFAEDLGLAPVVVRAGASEKFIGVLKKPPGG